MTKSTDHRLSCLACRSTNNKKWTSCRDIEYHTTDEIFDLYRCDDCTALFIDPIPLHRLSEIYPANYYSFSGVEKSFINNVKRWLDARNFRKIFKLINANEINILDIGGGSGWQLNMLRGLDARVKFTQIVDIDTHAESVAAANGHAYFCGTIENYDTEKKYNMILLLNLIEHVADPLAVLKKVAYLLAPNGIAILQTPNYDSLDERLFRNQSWGGYHCPRHWVLFNKESYLRLADKAGMAVKSFAYTQGAAFWAVSLLGLLNDRGVISISGRRPAVKHPLFPLISAAFAAFDFLRKPFSKTSQIFSVLYRK